MNKDTEKTLDILIPTYFIVGFSYAFFLASKMLLADGFPLQYIIIIAICSVLVSLLFITPYTIYYINKWKRPGDK